MALITKYPGVNPVGEWDGYDAIVTTVKGGEVGTIIPVALGSDKAAFDAEGSDGYTLLTRPAITNQLVSGARPLGLIDDGNSPYYGTLFGSAVGGTAGQLTTGAILGPHTAYASGKLTMWMKPGTFAVTLDAADTDPTDGLTTTNASLTIGSPLYATAAGLLTPDVSSAFENVVLARFVNFETNGSLVTTPASLVAPVSPASFTQACFEFAPPIA